MQAPQSIAASREDHELRITWTDGHQSDYPFKYLREQCQCAQCVHEITGELLLDPNSVPQDIQVNDAKLVGNYALKIIWSDGHDTGLYTWPRLRELCRCPACSAKPSEIDD